MRVFFAVELLFVVRCGGFDGGIGGDEIGGGESGFEEGLPVAVLVVDHEMRAREG